MTPDIDVTWNATLSASDGGSSACGATIYNDEDIASDYKWNVTYGHPGHQSNITDKVNGVVTYTSHSLSGGPNPGLAFSNNTYFNYSHRYGVDTTGCVTESIVYGYLAVGLIQVGHHGGLLGDSESFPFRAGVQVYDQDYWSCYNQTEWDQSTFHNISRSCLSDNISLTSLTIYQTGSNWTNTTGSANNASLAISGSWNVPIRWSYDFNLRHRYAIEVAVESSIDSDASFGTFVVVTQGFLHGSAKASAVIGIALRSVSIT